MAYANVDTIAAGKYGRTHESWCQSAIVKSGAVSGELFGLLYHDSLAI